MANAADRPDDAPHPIDRHVGLRIRMRRKELRLRGSIQALKLVRPVLPERFREVLPARAAARRVSSSTAGSPPRREAE